MSARRTLLSLAAPLIAAACFAPNSTTCRDGRVCPSGYSCSDDDPPTCVSVFSTTCPDGHLCPPGTRCYAAGCISISCSDHVKGDDEECDGADLGGATCATRGFYEETTGLRCADDCKLDTSGCTGKCNDGVINGGEDCDGTKIGTGNCQDAGFTYSEPPSCTSDCRWDYSSCSSFCGDGRVASGSTELCDGSPPVGETCLHYGFDRGLLGCSASCQPAFDGCQSFETGWSQIPTRGAPIRDLWAAHVDDLFAVGDQGALFHWDGSAWTSTTPDGISSDLKSVWGSRSGDVFAVGSGGTVLHGIDGMNGVVWSAMASDTDEDLVSVWNPAGNELFVAGTRTIRHWDGMEWTSFATPAQINEIWGSDRNNVFAVGDAGVALRWTLDGWAPWAPALPQDLTSIWGSDQNDVFVTGRNGFVWHWDGSQFSRVGGAPIRLWRVRGGGAGDVFVAGDGTLLHEIGPLQAPVTYPGPPWEPLALPDQIDIWALSVAAGQIYILGRTFEVFRLDRVTVTCTAHENNCKDGWDNDCDGLTDAADREDCKGKVVEQCANLVDDDNDGTIDCLDKDCSWFPSCNGPRR